MIGFRQIDFRCQRRPPRRVGGFHERFPGVPAICVQARYHRFQGYDGGYADCALKRVFESIQALEWTLSVPISTIKNNNIEPERFIFQTDTP